MRRKERFDQYFESRKTDIATSVLESKRKMAREYNPELVSHKPDSSYPSYMQLHELGDAGACQRETASVNPERKRCFESRCCRICLVRLPVNHRPCGSCGSCNLAHCMGRLGCSFGNRAAHCFRGSGGHARQGLWLFVILPRAKNSMKSAKESGRSKVLNRATKRTPYPHDPETKPR